MDGGSAPVYATATGMGGFTVGTTAAPVSYLGSSPVSMERGPSNMEEETVESMVAQDEDMVMAMDNLDLDDPVIEASKFAPSSSGPVLMNPMEENSTPRKLLDLLFIQDATGSQGSYISHATDNIEEICNTIVNTGRFLHKEDLRIGLIAYRDHPPQDHTFITKTFPFTNDVTSMKANLKSLYASGGGDGPEAVTAAMYEALNGLDWREEARKMIVLIADAPPHGIGEYGDGFDTGSPDGHDPLQLARQMANKGITLFFVACEPALSGYQNANEFYHAITHLTGGLVLPLTTASLLSHAIIGSVLENLEMEDLIRQVGRHVADRVLGGQESVDDVARALHETLMLSNKPSMKLKIESIYRTTEETAHNLNVWLNAPDIATARPQLVKINGGRFTEKYLNSKWSSTRGGSYHYSATAPAPYAPPLPPREASSSGGLAPTAVNPTGSPSRGPTSSSSPSTRQFGEFAAFEAPKATFTPPTRGTLKGAFAMRDTGSMNDDDDDDDEDGGPRQGVAFTEEAFSLDQARRIVMASAFRGMRV